MFEEFKVTHARQEATEVVDIMSKVASLKDQEKEELVEDFRQLDGEKFDSWC